MAFTSCVNVPAAPQVPCSVLHNPHHRVPCNRAGSMCMIESRCSSAHRLTRCPFCPARACGQSLLPSAATTHGRSVPRTYTCRVFHTSPQRHGSGTGCGDNWASSCCVQHRSGTMQLENSIAGRTSTTPVTYGTVICMRQCSAARQHAYTTLLLYTARSLDRHTIFKSHVGGWRSTMLRAHMDVASQADQRPHPRVSHRVQMYVCRLLHIGRIRMDIDNSRVPGT
jgi:hypothetical protein